MVHANAFSASSVSTDQTRWITLAGELDLATAPTLNAQLIEAADDPRREIVLDLSGLSFMDCVALRAVVDFADGARTRGWQLRVLSPPPRVARIFALTGTERTLTPLERPLEDDEVRALLALQPRSEALPHPAATVAVLRRDVVGATDDLPTVERWIAARGGERRIAPAVRAADKANNNGNPGWDGPFNYYVIPVAALDSVSA
jgi:anti-anti-sigma factor